MPKGVYERTERCKRSHCKEKIKLVCKQCGKQFEVLPFEKNRKYCSLQCSYKAKVGTINRNNDYLKGNQFAKGNKPNNTSFKKGHKAWNKEKKGTHFSPKTEFKKGQKGINWLAVGTKTQRKDENGTIREWIKIEEPNKWIEYAKFVWIKNNGKIPKGYLIHHIDENTLNDDINNLCLLTRKGHFEIHGIGKMGRDAKVRLYKVKESILVLK